MLLECGVFDIALRFIKVLAGRACHLALSMSNKLSGVFGTACVLMQAIPCMGKRATANDECHVWSKLRAAANQFALTVAIT